MPHQTRKLFVAGPDPRRDVNLDWLGDYTPTAMAEAFKIAADRVVDGCGDDPGHPDKFLYPAAFLYRHYLELEFKNLIALGRQLIPAVKDSTGATGHKLLDLWSDAKRVLLAAFSNDDPSRLQFVTDAVQEMSDLDPDGQGFRYYKNLKGARNLQAAPRTISLDNLREQMEEIFNFLVGCTVGIDALIDSQRETRDL